MSTESLNPRVTQTYGRTKKLGYSMFSYILGLHSLRKQKKGNILRRGALFPCYLSVSYTGNVIHSFYFIKENIFIRTLRLSQLYVFL